MVTGTLMEATRGCLCQQPELQCGVKDSMGCRSRPCLKNKELDTFISTKLSPIEWPFLEYAVAGME